MTEDDLLSPEQARQRAMAADRHLGSELVYLEYSGTYGGEEAEAILDQIADRMTQSRLWYGGGIDSREKAERMLQAGADTVVVGDVFHEVADEEATVCVRAREEFDEGAPRRAIREWIGEEVDVETSAAARYLRTIPAVDAPVATAERHLADTVQCYLALQRSDSQTLANVLGAQTRTELDDALAANVDVSQYLSAITPQRDDGQVSVPLTHVSVFE
ncbi:geranylgeranylglyceryl/heptaprenylglyceryl phosphate synthase [Haloarculaceae archaeon H-GB2-1]|nr:geranylgeranylglyceryl/heptaprenylglyceryl phosphate synthase [Haloarculaceae archaeon H-GB11]MEA5407170.1 geranylgeranylglyceryl/heptaprenylglyceryl phosphate synthase [Haloarculaceae archaeon H-GB2-1]